MRAIWIGRVAVAATTSLVLAGASVSELALTWPTGIPRGIDSHLAAAYAGGVHLLSDAPAQANPTLPGPFRTESLDITYTHGTREYAVHVTLPAGAPPAPVAIILPSGLFGEAANHAGHAAHLASWGIAAAVPAGMDVEDSSDTAVNGERARAVLDAVVNSGRVQPRAVAVGTHYNGMSALAAAAADSRFRAVIGLHPSAFLRQSMAWAAESRVPLLALVGTEVPALLCPYGSTWSEIYFSARTPQRAIVRFEGASPADFLDPPYNDGINLCGTPRGTPFVWIRGLMTAWIAYYVLGEQGVRPLVFDAEGGAVLPPEARDSRADTRPLGLAVSPEGDDSARLAWQSRYTDTTALAGFAVLRATGSGAFVERATLPLVAETWSESGLEGGIEYHYTLEYRDQAGRGFQRATPGSVVGGAPTGTPSPSATASRTPTNTRTPTVTRTPTLGPTPATPGVPLHMRAYVPYSQK